jgi:hypothetical protein
MPYDLRQWPASIYPGEANEFPEARAEIDLVLRMLRAQGPQPDGYNFKHLGKALGGLWQINLKVKGRQIRFLYAPYGRIIVIFRIHKKSSVQEQRRAYELAMSRKKQAEQIMRSTGGSDVKLPTIH